MSDINMMQTIDPAGGELTTKNINISTGGDSMSDVQAGIEFVYHMREHILDIGVATVYGLVVYAIVLYINKKIKGYD